MRRIPFELLLLPALACTHAAPAPSSEAASRHAEMEAGWVVALKSDVQRLAANDGFEGVVRVVKGGRVEIEDAFGPPGCLPLGPGRRLLTALALGSLADEGRVDLLASLARPLPELRGTSLEAVRVADAMADAAGLALPSGDGPEAQLAAASRTPLVAAPGTRVDPSDDRPWWLLERVVARAAGAPFEEVVARRVIAPAELRATALVPTAACPQATGGTTSVDDLLRLVTAFRSGTLVKPATAARMLAPHVALAEGVARGLGFALRSAGARSTAGLVGSGKGTPVLDLWFSLDGQDALVLLGRSPTTTARELRTTLGEFYALPPAPPSPGGVPRRGGR